MIVNDGWSMHLQPVCMCDPMFARGYQAGSMML